MDVNSEEKYFEMYERPRPEDPPEPPSPDPEPEPPPEPPPPDPTEHELTGINENFKRWEIIFHI